MDLLTQLRRDEGVRYSAYRDTLGNWTIGVGHLILPTEQWLLTSVISDDQINVLLSHDIAAKQAQLIQFDWYNAMDDIRSAAIENMAFNLGVTGVLHFPSMLHYIAVQDWPNAAAQALNSTWAHQVGGRAQRIAQQLETGQWV